MAVPPPSFHEITDKAALRIALRQRRRAFAETHAFLSDILRATHCRPVCDLIAQAKIISGYWPSASEADVRPLLDFAQRLGKCVALPRFVLGSGEMCFHAWKPTDELEIYRGYAMPRTEAPEVLPDLILAPLVAFDRNLNRLGQGGGFYDRAFSANPHATKVGIAWSAQEVDRLVSEPHDIPLHAVLTELEWIIR